MIAAQMFGLQSMATVVITTYNLGYWLKWIAFLNDVLQIKSIR